MAIRYAKFLGIMVHTVVPTLASSPGGGGREETGAESGATDMGFQSGDLMGDPLDESLVAEGLGDLDTLSNLGPASELFSLWESMYIFPQIT
ncbi:unnamed protein product [Fusarium venenatum]|uniref:Uncharacterized protein n=2 Tax=Fusarium venenatum TaxID=56646 RepID=A0A2L2T925_9HYPO|nr:uncharacterized protein FVRRES_03924 [Fusarium venenatum]CEI67412.1 unnamed protein product [Fusarium venenatum]